MVACFLLTIANPLNFLKLIAQVVSTCGIQLSGTRCRLDGLTGRVQPNPLRLFHQVIVA